MGAKSTTPFRHRSRRGTTSFRVMLWPQLPPRRVLDDLRSNFGYRLAGHGMSDTELPTTSKPASQRVRGCPGGVHPRPALRRPGPTGELGRLAPLPHLNDSCAAGWGRLSGRERPARHLNSPSVMLPEAAVEPSAASVPPVEAAPRRRPSAQSSPSTHVARTTASPFQRD